MQCASPSGHAFYPVPIQCCVSPHLDMHSTQYSYSVMWVPTWTLILPSTHTVQCGSPSGHAFYPVPIQCNVGPHLDTHTAQYLYWAECMSTQGCTHILPSTHTWRCVSLSEHAFYPVPVLCNVRCESSWTCFHLLLGLCFLWQIRVLAVAPSMAQSSCGLLTTCCRPSSSTPCLNTMELRGGSLTVYSLSSVCKRWFSLYHHPPSLTLHPDVTLCG